MNYKLIRRLKEKLYFTVEDLQDLLRIKHASALVLCNRYANNGFFVRLKRNFYVLSESWNNYGKDSFLKCANLLQVPSYISFMTALSIHGMSTQVQRDFFESACLKRSARIEIDGATFNYSKLKKQYYFGFAKQNNVFIAGKEKAFIDAVYLNSFGKYKFDLSSIDTDKLDKNKLKRMSTVFPPKTKDAIKKICRI